MRPKLRVNSEAGTVSGVCTEPFLPENNIRQLRKRRKLRECALAGSIEQVRYGFIFHNSLFYRIIGAHSVSLLATMPSRPIAEQRKESIIAALDRDSHASRVARALGDKTGMSCATPARAISSFPAGPANTGDVLGFMAALPGDSDQVDAQAFIDQKPHQTAMASSFRRPRRTGC
jgi:hypothetical protein